MCCLIHSREGRLSYTVSLPWTSYLPSRQRWELQSRKVCWKKKVILPVFSCPPTWALCRFNLQHQNWSNHVSIAPKFISTCNSPHNVLWTWDQKGEKKGGTVFHWGKVEKVGIKRTENSGEKVKERLGRKARKPESSKGIWELTKLIISISTDCKWFHFHCDMIKELCPGPEILSGLLRISTLVFNDTSGNPG